MEMLRRCPLAIAQRLVHCAIAVSTAVLGQSHKDNVRCTAVEQQLEAKEVQLWQPSSTSLLMISSGLRVQLHLPPLDLAWNSVWNVIVYVTKMTKYTFPFIVHFITRLLRKKKVELCRYGKSAIICLAAGIPNKEATLPVRSKTQALAFCIYFFNTGLFVTGFITKYMAILYLHC